MRMQLKLRTRFRRVDSGTERIVVIPNPNVLHNRLIFCSNPLFLYVERRISVSPGGKKAGTMILRKGEDTLQAIHSVRISMDM